MKIGVINSFRCNNFSFKKDESKSVKTSHNTWCEVDEPQIWFGTEIGADGTRQMYGTHRIGFSDVIGPDGTRAPIFETRC